MTDNEIIMALEYCYADENNCKRCPYMAVDKCHKAHTRDVLALINRQNDLIYRQSDVISEQKEKIERMYVDAAKEFAERLIEKAEDFGIDEDFLYSEFDGFKTYDTVAEAVKHLTETVVKEMVGEENGIAEENS